MARYYSLEHRAMAVCLPMTSTLVELQFRHGTAFQYHDYIITAWCFDTENGKSSSAVYLLDESDTDTHVDNRDATLVYFYDREFDDIGDAVLAAIERARCIHSERLMKRKV